MKTELGEYRFGDPTQWQRTQELALLTNRLLVGQPPKVWKQADHLLRFGVSADHVCNALQLQRQFLQPRPPDSPEPNCPHLIGGGQSFRCDCCKAAFCPECWNVHEFLFHWEDSHED